MARRIAWLWSCLVLFGCGDDPQLTLPGGSGGAGGNAPFEDPVAVCDQAADGTPCEAPHLHKHCVFRVCSFNVCGDGVPAQAEQCDDGNDRAGDGCSARCQLETEGVCGNGARDGDEECDDGNRNDGDLCANACVLNVCRNGRIDVGEECDDGNLIDSGEIEPGVPDTCSNDCKLTICGNLRIDRGEECDDGNRSDTDACANACTANVCGNTRVDPGEACDGGRNAQGAPCMGDCTGYGIDACLACTAEQCRDYEGFDVYTSCRELADPNLTLPLPEFVERCSALDDCIRRNGCYLTDTGVVPCYCGFESDGAPVDAALCQAGTRVLGACQPEFVAASYPPPTQDNLDAWVMGQMTDLTYPTGFAGFLAKCRAERCAHACAPASP